MRQMVLAYVSIEGWIVHPDVNSLFDGSKLVRMLEFCLKNTHSPLSPIIANLYMEAFEKKAINTSPTPPSLWRKFVDDTFVIIKKT